MRIHDARMESFFREEHGKVTDPPEKVGPSQVIVTFREDFPGEAQAFLSLLGAIKLGWHGPVGIHPSFDPMPMSDGSTAIEGPK